MITFKRISTTNDIDLIKDIFRTIFPEEKNYDFMCYYESIQEDNNDMSLEYLEYYMVLSDSDIVGLCGLYNCNNDDVWLGWFGVLPDFRRLGFGSIIPHKMIDLAESRGFKCFRLYTDSVINRNAIPLYQKFGFVKDSEYDGNIITMAKSLDGNSHVKWCGKPYGM